MPLPTSREETATAAASVKANTINAIQDCLVAAAALKEINLNAALWQPIVYTTFPTYAGGVWQHPGAGAFRFILPLSMLPVGAQVHEITIGYFRGTGSAGCLIARHTIAAVVQTTRDIVTADVTGAAYETQTITSVGAGLAIGGGVGPLIIEAGSAFSLDFAIAGGVTGTLGPAQIKYLPGTA